MYITQSSSNHCYCTKISLTAAYLNIYSPPNLSLTYDRDAYMSSRVIVLEARSVLEKSGSRAPGCHFELPITSALLILDTMIIQEI